VTDSELAEARLGAEIAHARFASLLDSLRAIAWEGELQTGSLTYVSSNAEQILGYPASAFVDFDFLTSLVHPDDRPLAVELGRRAVEERRDIHQEVRLLARDGRVVWTHSWLYVARDPVASSPSMRGLIVDVSESKRAETEREWNRARLLQNQKWESLGVFAGGIAHEFNNLLAAILGNASLALLGIPEGLPARLLVEDILRASQRGSELTRQLLAYGGRSRLDQVPIDLSAFAGESRPLLEAALGPNVALSMELAGDLPAVQADVALLQRALLNLVINAAEAIGEAAGRIVVRTRRAALDDAAAARLTGAEHLRGGDYVVLEVEDTGCGMDRSIQERAFDPFFGTRGAGRGLGLPMVLGVVRAHGGGVELASAPGSGTRASLLLPPSAAAGASSSAPRKSAPGRVVLIIDDEPWVRSTTAKMLDHLGFRSMAAASGPEGIELFRAHAGEISLVLLDLTMPEMDGELVFQQLRGIEPGVPVVVSSGFSEADTARRMSQAGAAGFLEKPYTVQQLGKTLEEITAGGR
jgi:PAS domain S-box-containing protein